MEHYLSRLEHAIKGNWNSPALCNYRGEEFTFGELASNMAKFHLLFEKSGIRKGDKISICAKNSARWAISFLSINTYGAVAVPLLSEFLPSSVAHLTDHSDSVLLFTDSEIWSKINPDDVPGIKGVVNCADYTLLFCRDEKLQKAFENLQALFNAKFPMGFGRENVSFPTDNAGDMAVINYTSGTTSAPKGVMLRYECFSTTIQFGVENVPLTVSDKLVSMLPMGHIYGLVFEFLFPICCGVTIYYLGKTPSPSLLLQAMKTVRPAYVATVPLVMEKVFKSSIKPVVSKWYMKILLHTPLVGTILYRKIGEKLLDAFGGNIRIFIMGGAALNPEAEKYFRRMRIPYTVGYGMTEAAPLLGYEWWKEYAPGSCGKAAAWCDVRIDSEDPQHIAGEIQAKGTNICSGYYKNDEANAVAFTDDGYLRTGDLGVIDSKGNLFIKGRCKTMFLSANGQNIYPEEIEAVINSQPYVAESLVVDRSDRLVALVYLDKDSIRRDKLDEETVSDIPERIRINSNRMLPGYSKLTKVEIVLEPFEKTPKMSIKRFLYK